MAILKISLEDDEKVDASPRSSLLALDPPPPLFAETDAVLGVKSASNSSEVRDPSRFTSARVVMSNRDSPLLPPTPSEVMPCWSWSCFDAIQAMRSAIARCTVAWSSRERYSSLPNDDRALQRVRESLPSWPRPSFSFANPPVAPHTPPSAPGLGEASTTQFVTITPSIGVSYDCCCGRGPTSTASSPPSTSVAWVAHVSTVGVTLCTMPSMASSSVRTAVWDAGSGPTNDLSQ